MDKQEIFLEQYKLFVKTADDITMRRLQTNKFYLTILLGLFTIAGFFNKNGITGILNEQIILILISVIGVVLSIIWYVNIESFKLLNSAKFKVIHEMEKDLPCACFDKEWQYRVGEDESKAYPILTKIEKFLPIMMGIVFFIILLVGLFL